MVPVQPPGITVDQPAVSVQRSADRVYPPAGATIRVIENEAGMDNIVEMAWSENDQIHHHKGRFVWKPFIYKDWVKSD